MRPVLFALLFSVAATPALAQKPSFTTPAVYAYMKDISSGKVLYSKEADTRIPPASMGKMMSVYVAFDMLERGDATLEQKILVRPETWKKWHSQGSTMFLSVNEQVSVENLLHGIVTLSGNDACVVLAEGLGGTEENYVALMNRAAKKIGVTNSQFANTNGWPDPNEYVTARDLALIAEATIRDFPDLYKKFYGTEKFTWGKTLGKGEAITQPNRNPLLGRISGADGLKTGHTEEAGYGFTGSAVQGGRRLVMVVAGLSSFNERIGASVDFMSWGFNAWQGIPVLKAGQVVGKAAVAGGVVPDVTMVSPRDTMVTVPRGLGSERKTRVVAVPGLKAPIAKGQKVGEMLVSVQGNPDTRLPLVAGAAVEEAGPVLAAWLWLKSLVGM
ncbi:D-alanyl-D-alanine carboxypeptidase family protein [Polymorphobacter fuscus]|uniref:serine-type D-Ala-D-Ala carboxypeptidase n=1 Tax=Sandarakinorhabdus fusca TaxID=1439888 RepID=A0A7C9KVX8_9SPHN|nr:D-alanyl-D-alanine carboxypeptidase family protein [Polymorphobacter fuscus]KAB7648682.1 D-alanyl-D-alanine carboxypeptidase [Polymorphobacter fuscus]MQT16242.1 D-alanyl-D-alanine carboxypeptidase [Polymorphobacter fuscus]NJC07473.1 D-alanyl-D-alanine carboxypeptidase (penicillin-binding protein 5/6) [Polymorphobacter fuscus]